VSLMVLLLVMVYEMGKGVPVGRKNGGFGCHKCTDLDSLAV